MTKGASAFFPAIGTKYNKCHGPKGRFCSTGGGAGGGSFTLQDGQEVVDELAERYDMPKVEVKEGADGEGTVYAAASARGSGIQVNSQLINDPLTYDPKYNDAAPTNAREIMIHEYGHVIHNQLSNNDAYYEHGLSRPSIVNAHNGEWKDTLGSRLDRIARIEGDRISDYATRNGEEYVAEAFVLYNRGASHHSRINSDLLKVFKKLDSKNK